MRKTIVILLLIYLFTGVYSQVIKGKVMDSNTRDGIEFAAVYFSGTSTGTYTKQAGYFEIGISEHKSMPLTISALGYYSITITGISYDKLFFIYLTPKEYELNEVVIAEKKNPAIRRSNLNTFKREFLGTTPNARSCIVENENDVIFTFKPENDTLMAFSSNPIIIYNKALGYKIIYYLDKFEYSSSVGFLRLIGNYIFIADTTKFINLQEQFDRKRKKAFLGSRMHFFRSLWNNNLDQAGFVVTDYSNVRLSNGKVVPYYSGVRLTYDKLVTRADTSVGQNSLKYIKHPGSLFVLYRPRLLQSQMIMIKDSVSFNETGFFDPFGILWQGEMAKTRIGDLLPFEYKPE